VVHLNKLHEEYDEKGLTIMSVSGEPEDKVVAFVEEFEAQFPVLWQAQNAAYSTGGVPQAYLISAEGVVTWEGNPGALSGSTIENQLKDVPKDNRVSTWTFKVMKGLPPLPDSMSAIRKHLEKRKFGAALKAAEAAVAKLEGEDKEAGEKVREYVASSGTADMEKAAALQRDGKIYEAYLTYESVEDRYKGHDLSKQAKQAAKALKKDKQGGLEIKAGEKFAKIKKEMREERKPEDKLKCLKPLLSKKYAETVAGKQAAKIASTLK
jgi:hypothetical protein